VKQRPQHQRIVSPSKPRSEGEGVESEPTTSLADEQICIIELESSMIERLAILGQQANWEKMLDASTSSLERHSNSEDRHVSPEFQKLMVNLGLSTDEQLSQEHRDALFSARPLERLCVLAGRLPQGNFDDGTIPCTTSERSPGPSPLQNILTDSIGDSGSSTRSCASHSTNGRSPAASDRLDATSHSSALQVQQGREEINKHADSRLEPEDRCKMGEEEMEGPGATAWMTAAEKQWQEQRQGPQQADDGRQRSSVDAEVERQDKSGVTRFLRCFARPPLLARIAFSSGTSGSRRWAADKSKSIEMHCFCFLFVCSGHCWLPASRTQK